MSDEQPVSEMDEYYARTRRQLIRKPTTLTGKIGCGALLVIWFGLLMLPFVMFWLAAGKNITIPRGNVPEADQHPRWQVHLVMEKDNRGLQFLTTQVQRNNRNNVCVEAHVNYLLWERDDETNAAVYCQCYERDDTESLWTFTGTLNTTCTQ